MINVVTYSSSGDETIDLTESQAAKLREAGVWPKDQQGREYCQVSRGLHSEHEASFSDAEIDRIIAGENAGQILAGQFYGDEDDAIERSDAYNTGFEAAKQGEPRTSNPYGPGTWDRNAWFAGWDAE